MTKTEKQIRAETNARMTIEQARSEGIELKWDAAVWLENMLLEGYDLDEIKAHLRKLQSVIPNER